MDARMDLDKQATWRSSDQHLKEDQGAQLKAIEYLHIV
jgi:hypothetical protein